MPGGTPAGDPKCQVKIGANECGGKHGEWYHSTTGGIANTGAAVVGGELSPSRRPGLYEVYAVAVPAVSGPDQVGTVLVDPGSDTDYIRHNFARWLGIQGTPYSYFLKVVDSEFVLKKSAKYKFEMVDRFGVVHRISALGLETITTLPPESDLDPLLPLLSGVPREVLEHPQGVVDVLLGLGSSSLHGKMIQEWGNLRLLETSFGCGRVLRGSHQSLKFPTTSLKPVLSTEAQAMLGAVCMPPGIHSVFHLSMILDYNQGFSELNELGCALACLNMLKVLWLFFSMWWHSK